MTKIINVMSNRNYRTRDVKRVLIQELKERGYEPTVRFDPQAELTISIGGDGTFLKTIHENRFPTMPLVGVNTGTLGFFQEIHPSELPEFLDAYESGDYTLEEIDLLEVKIVTSGRTFYRYAVNEMQLMGEPYKVIQMNVFLDGNHLQKFAGDGLLVCTPVGSTAYNFSLNGSIVHTQLKSLQMTPMAPINSTAYRSLGGSILMPPDSLISLVPTRRYKDSSTVVVDGKGYSYYNLERVEVTTSKYSVYRMLFRKDFYWKNLKDKFL